MSKFTEITVICNIPHDIPEGECAFCQRDSAMKDALRYRWLRDKEHTASVWSNISHREGDSFDAAVDASMEAGEI